MAMVMSTGTRNYVFTSNQSASLLNLVYLALTMREVTKSYSFSSNSGDNLEHSCQVLLREAGVEAVRKPLDGIHIFVRSLPSPQLHLTPM
jgi:hypothetical protein